MRLILAVALFTLVIPSNRSWATGGFPSLTSKRYVLAAAIAEDKILRFDAATGAFVDEFVPNNSGGLNEPAGMAVGPDGHLYVASAASNQVLRYDGTTGSFLGVFAQNGRTPIGVSFGPGGDLFVASRDAPGVLRYDGQTGAPEGLFATTDTGDLWWAFDLAIRPDGFMYVSSFERQTVLRFDSTSGDFAGIFANARNSLTLPRASGLAFGPDGDLFVAGFVRGVDRFDGTTGAAKGTFLSLASDDAAGIRFNHDGDLIVGLSNRGGLLKVDGQTGAVVGELTAPVTWTQTYFVMITVPEPGTGYLLAWGAGLAASATRRSRI